MLPSETSTTNPNGCKREETAGSNTQQLQYLFTQIPIIRRHFYMKLKHSSQTVVQLIPTMQQRLHPAGYSTELCRRQRTPHGTHKWFLGATGMVPPLMFQLHNLPCTCSSWISLVLLQTRISQHFFQCAGSDEVWKYQQAGNLFSSENHLLDYKVWPHPGAGDARGAEQGKATPLHASSGPEPAQHCTTWGAELLLAPKYWCNGPQH